APDCTGGNARTRYWFRFREPRAKICPECDRTDAVPPFERRLRRGTLRRKDRTCGHIEPARQGEETMRSHLLAAFAGATAVRAFGPAPACAAPFMIVGNDEKVLWDDAGKLVLSPPGKDSVLIVDLAAPMTPKIVANLPLKNSVVGPPV